MVKSKKGPYQCKRGEHGVGKVLGRDKWVHISSVKFLPLEDQKLVKLAHSALLQVKGINLSSKRTFTKKPLII